MKHKMTTKCLIPPRKNNAFIVPLSFVLIMLIPLTGNSDEPLVLEKEYCDLNDGSAGATFADLYGNHGVGDGILDILVSGVGSKDHSLR
ncbi:hypothetical protein GF312_06785, partial [Candidatus Poribacteria bacterium]|nr:hypothetical protein [Candidatus Poribacteria bacterium]